MKKYLHETVTPQRRLRTVARIIRDERSTDAFIGGVTNMQEQEQEQELASRPLPLQPTDGNGRTRYLRYLQSSIYQLTPYPNPNPDPNLKRRDSKRRLWAWRAKK
jgi:hypothetical protein